MFRLERVEAEGLENPYPTHLVAICAMIASKSSSSSSTLALPFPSLPFRFDFAVEGPEGETESDGSPGNVAVAGFFFFLG